jgi:hypothetical protein
MQIRRSAGAEDCAGIFLVREYRTLLNYRNAVMVAKHEPRQSAFGPIDQKQLLGIRHHGK